VFTEASAEALGQADELEVAAQRLQPAIASKLFTTKLVGRSRLTTAAATFNRIFGPNRVAWSCVDYALYKRYERPFFFNQSISTGKNFLP
jgi:hypothetical protein